MSINNSIRLRDGKFIVQLSDLLEGAPEPVFRALAHILLSEDLSQAGAGGRARALPEVCIEPSDYAARRT